MKDIDKMFGEIFGEKSSPKDKAEKLRKLMGQETDSDDEAIEKILTRNRKYKTLEDAIREILKTEQEDIPVGTKFDSGDANLKDLKGAITHNLSVDVMRGIVEAVNEIGDDLKTSLAVYCARSAETQEERIVNAEPLSLEIVAGAIELAARRMVKAYKMRNEGITPKDVKEAYRLWKKTKGGKDEEEA